MSTTYKPALLKAIVRILRRDPTDTIPLTTIGAEFTRLCWNQTVVFHLRQAAVISKESEVIRAMRQASERYNVRDLSELPAAALNEIEHSMARILTIDVIRRSHAGKPDHMPPLFTWQRGDTAISVPASALDFIISESTSSRR